MYSKRGLTDGFRRIDTDHKGSLGGDELKAFFMEDAHCPWFCNDRTIACLVDFADLNDDDSIAVKAAKDQANFWTSAPTVGFLGPGGAAGQPVMHTALQKMVHRCVSKCDGDVRKEMIGNVLLTGAGSQFKYFPERLQREVAAIVPSSFKVKIVCPEKIERRFGV